MDLTFRQKVVVFGVMFAVFMGSVVLKQVILSPGGLGESGGIVSASQVQEEASDTAVGADSAQDAQGEVIIVDVEGAVTFPGVVKIKPGSRVYEAIDQAGGLLETADTKYVNLAEEVTDGSIIYIPVQGENDSGAAADGGEGTASGTPGSASSGLVNINTADKTSLMTLPGIGEAYAQAIIDYRESTGSFKSKEDIKNVSGIGDAKYAKLESMICVY